MSAAIAQGWIRSHCDLSGAPIAYRHFPELQRVGTVFLNPARDTWTAIIAEHSETFDYEADAREFVEIEASKMECTTAGGCP